jgi:hypothetical protein
MPRHPSSVATFARLMGLALPACATAPDLPSDAEFVVVACPTPQLPGGERFRIRLADSTQIALANDNLDGRNQRFVVGRLAAGDGGFNAPWNWHLKPDSTWMVESTVEACHACPSTAEAGGESQLGSLCIPGSQVVRRDW